RAVGQPLRERTLALLEPGRGGAEDAVGVRVLLEYAQQQLVGDPAGGRDAHRDRRPRRYSSWVIRRLPSGCTSSSSSDPSSSSRAFQTTSGRPSTTALAPTCGDRARMRLTSSWAGLVRSSSRSAGVSFSA